MVEKFYQSLTLEDYQNLLLEEFQVLRLEDTGPVDDYNSFNRLAQIFDVDAYSPSKIEVYLKRAGENSGNSFDLTNHSVYIDASNFAAIESADRKLYLGDETSGFTGNGYMQVDDSITSTDFSRVNYPIQSFDPKGIYVKLRCLSQTGTHTIEVYVDDVLHDEVNVVANGDWEWVVSKIVLGDTDVHNLGIRLKESGQLLDKLYLTTDSSGLFTSEAVPYTSPYFTVHFQLYETNSDLEPTSPLFIYDYKTSLEDILYDDWYGFVSKPLSGTINFSGSYAIVLSSSGGSYSNFAIWDMVDNDEYNTLPSAIRV